MTLYITGGGGCLVKNFYKFAVADRVKFIDDIVLAAGYGRLTEVQLAGN